MPVGAAARYATVLDGAGVPHSGVTPAGMITFRDPDNVQWEFFEEAA